MKKKYLIPILLLLFSSCEKDNIEIPNEVIVAKSYQNLVDSLSTFFTESKNIYVSTPDFFNDSAKKNIVLSKESEVYVTFLDENASFKNTLCWYSYNIEESVPLRELDIIPNVVFPNISKIDGGGQLKPGDIVQLGSGTFPPKTVIGFILIQNGWQDDGSIDYNLPMFYTDFNLNKTGKQQHILFQYSNFSYILIGFEDGQFEFGDKDYNDVIFAITDNKEGYAPTSFDLKNVKVLK